MRSKNVWILIIFMLSGIVVGGYLGDIATKIPYFSWLNYGRTFGLTDPLSLDMGIINLLFGISIKFTIAGILGMILAIFIYRRM